MSLQENSKHKNMKNVKIFALGFAILSIVSCRKENTIVAGPLVDEDRLIPLYSDVHVEGDLNVMFTSDTSYLVRISAPQNLLQHIKTQVVGNELRIFESKNHVITRKKVTVYLSKKSISKIVLNGSGDITGTGLTANHFEVELKGSGDVNLSVDASTVDIDLFGSGDIDLSGTANQANLELNGSGDIDARHLPVNTATVELDGSGNLSVRANTQLTIDLEGSGDVFYWGNPPVINATVSGSGDIHNMH